jgi:hypothetical protein
LKEFNYVTLASRHDISEPGFLYKTANGVLENSAFLVQLNFNIRKGKLCILLSHPENINVQEFAIA